MPLKIQAAKCLQIPKQKDKIFIFGGISSKKTADGFWQNKIEKRILTYDI